MDLHSRKIAGWSMQPTLARGIVVDALLVAVWKRKPKERVVVHSDQGSRIKDHSTEAMTGFASAKRTSSIPA